jgi:dolichyl-phosphate-mannose-protein mannosyltransferase
MIEDVLGLLAGLAGLVPLGAGLLLLTGLWSEFRGILRVGLAVFAGMAGATVLLPPLVYAGLAPAVPLVLSLGAVALAGGIALERRRNRADGAPNSPGLGLELVPAAFIALPLAVLAGSAVLKPDGAFDAFTNWGLKAKLLYFSGSGLIDHRIFDPMFATDSLGPPVERVYPIGLPALESYFIHAMGGPDFRVLHLLFVAFLAGLALVSVAFLRPYVGPWALAAGASIVLWMPAARDQAASENADAPMACLWVAAVLLVGLWFVREQSRWLALAAVFAAAAVATKREGAIYTAILLGLALLAVLLDRRRDRVKPVVFTALFVGATAAPWRIFVGAHELTGHDVSVSPSRIAAHRDELPLITRELSHLLADRIFLGVVPAAAAAAVLLIALNRDRRLAAAFLVLVAAVLLTLVVVYVNSRPDTRYLLRTTARRTLLTPALLSATLLPLLLTQLFRVPVAEVSTPPARTGGERLRRLAGVLEP